MAPTIRLVKTTIFIMISVGLILCIIMNQIANNPSAIKASVDDTIKIHNGAFTDYNYTSNKDDKYCYIYMIPMSFATNYFHFWQSFLVSLRISNWSDECDLLLTKVYLPPKNNHFTNLANAIFGKFNVFSVDQIESDALYVLLDNISLYWNISTPRSRQQWLESHKWLQFQALFAPLQKVIMSKNISLSYMRYGSFAIDMKQYQPADKPLTDDEIHSILRQHTYLDYRLERESYDVATSQKAIQSWRQYLIKNLLHINIDDYSLNYYLHHGYITILNRTKRFGERSFDRRATIALINELMEQFHINSTRIRVVTFENVPFRNQVKIALESTVLISPHGAGLVNAMFMDPAYSVTLNICPFYVHCRAGRCNMYPTVLSSYNWKSFSLELRDVNCSVTENKLSMISKDECESLPDGDLEIRPSAVWNLFQRQGFARNINMGFYSAQMIQSIKEHFMYLNGLNRYLYNETYDLLVDYYNLTWNAFIAHYCD